MGFSHWHNKIELGFDRVSLHRLTLGVFCGLRGKKQVAGHRSGESVWDEEFRRRDGDGCDRDGRAPMEIANDWGSMRG